VRPFLTLWLWGPVVLSAAVLVWGGGSGPGRSRRVSAWSAPKACETVDPDFVKLLTRYSRPCPIGPRGGPPETRFPRCSTRS